MRLIGDNLTVMATKGYGRLADIFGGDVPVGPFAPTFCMGNPLQKRISKICSSVQRLPRDSMFVFSDYGGQHKKSKYEVFSYMVVDPDASFCWLRNQEAFRKYALPDGRRMSFKGLNDKRKLGVLNDFLMCADKIHGVCFTFCLKKPDLFYGKSIDSLDGFVFKKKIIERTFIKAELAAYIIGLLSTPFQHVNWVTDHDEVVANDRLHDDFLELLRTPLNWYLPHILKEISVGPPGENDLFEEDCLSIPDLICGAMGETLAKGTFSEFVATPVPRMSWKTEAILGWMGHRDNLYKLPPIVIENIDGAIRSKHITVE